ncbi:hrp65 protein-like [Ctenocephalides felis]|uniref:hrp65 protein-like n=1 Tax=Ctenocephalides felis TaxID=7515 RepID=UPI000E6E5AC8|nr:hrp65 protein-like [Ctenocephalides felis]
MLQQKLQTLAGPVLDLPPLDMAEVKFTGRGRLYVGNLTNDVTEEEIIEMFKPYGETSKHFINKENSFIWIHPHGLQSQC